MSALVSARPRLSAFVLQLALALAAFGTAFAVRYDLRPAVIPWEDLLYSLPVVAAIRAGAILSYRLHRGLWWHVEVDDLLQILRAVTSGSLVLALVVLVARSLDTPHVSAVPVGVIFLDLAANVGFLVAARVASQVVRRSGEARASGEEARPVLVVGAGEAGVSLVTQLLRSPRYRLRPVAFCDDDPRKVGSTIARVPVAGTCDDIPRLVETYGAELIVLALPSVTGPDRRRIVRLCQEAGVPFRTLPSLPELLVADISPSQIREVDALDLLGRPVARVEPALLARAVRGRRVLITGAAGSVGGELARQIAHLEPASLALIDRAETPLLFAQQHLSQVAGLNLTARIVDVTDRPSVKRFMRSFRPDVVFHAAAHKHVPLMEDTPAEAVRNNVGGTLIVAEEAEDAGSSCFVLISTDKAVNPSSVMGATKRIAELALRDLASSTRMNIVAVRFGNVLGSNGSVVPIFREQIAQGGPVRVTDRRMERYFMALPEAAALILEAAAVGERGQVLVLDMGEPVNMLEMAETMVALSGLRPYEDIDIVFTGARPGEKLREELQYQAEQVLPTPHDKLLVLRGPDEQAGMLRKAHALLLELPSLDDQQAAQRMWRLVGTETPEAIPAPAASPIFFPATGGS